MGRGITSTWLTILEILIYCTNNSFVYLWKERGRIRYWKYLNSNLFDLLQQFFYCWKKFHLLFKVGYVWISKLLIIIKWMNSFNWKFNFFQSNAHWKIDKISLNSNLNLLRTHPLYCENYDCFLNASWGQLMKDV